MTKSKRKRTKKLPGIRDWNMVSLINRAGGKGKHNSKKHKPRTTGKIQFRKSLMEFKPWGFFFWRDCHNAPWM